MSQFMRSVNKAPKAPAPKRAAASKPPAKPFKSAELVEDSDQDEEEPTAPEIKASSPKPKSGSLRPIDSKKTTSVKAPSKVSKPPQKGKSPKPSGTESQSSERQGVSSSRSLTPKNRISESIESKPKKDIKKLQGTSPTTNSKKVVERSPSESETNGDSSEDHLDLEVQDSRPTRKREALGSHKQGLPERTSLEEKALKPKGVEESRPTNQEVSSDGSSSTSDDGIGSESENESDDENSDGLSEKPAATAIAKPKSQHTAPKLNYVPYAPPSGFEPVSKRSVHSASQQAELFSPASLQGKEIWHITVPTGVSINSIKEVAQQSVQDGSAVLSYKGADYGLVAEAEGVEFQEMLLLPSDEGIGYKPSKHGVTRTLHLQQLIRPQTGSRVSSDLSKFTASKDRPRLGKPLPQQPEGLKMRYMPFGAEDSDDSAPDSALKGSQKAPQFITPKGLESSTPAKKRKRDEPDVQGPSRSRSPKKSRRNSHSATSSPAALVRKGVSPTEQKLKGPKQPLRTTQVATPAKNPRLSSSSTNGEEHIAQAKVQDTTESYSKRKRKKRKTGDDETSKPTTRTNHDRQPSVIGPSLEKAPTSISKPQPMSAPVTNGYTPSTSKPQFSSKSPQKQDKPKKQTSATPPVASISPPKVVRAPVTTNSNANNSSKLSNHDRDATTGAKSAEKQSSSKSTKAASPGKEQASSGRKSKHEGETPEERTKRKAERKKRKEMKANGKA